MIGDDWWPPLEIPTGKLVDHLLNVDHPKGGPKARFFLAFGFHPSRPNELGRALLAQTDALFGTDAMRVVEIDGWTRLVCEGPIQAPDGRTPRVRTVWQQQGAIAYRLITAIPARTGDGQGSDHRAMTQSVQSPCPPLASFRQTKKPPD